MRKALLLSFMLAMGMILFASPPDNPAEKNVLNNQEPAILDISSLIYEAPQILMNAEVIVAVTPDTGPLVLEKVTMPIVILPDNLIAPAPDTGPMQINYIYICTADHLNNAAADLAMPLPVLRE